MQRNKKLIRPALMSLAIVLSMMLLLNIDARTSQAQTSSAGSSQPSTIPAASPTPDTDAALRQACSDAITELAAAKRLIASQGILIKNDAEVQAIQDQLINGLKNLRTLDAEEKQDLRRAIDAAGRQTAALEAEVAVLKKQKFTFWKAVKYVVYGAAAGAIAITVLKK